MYGRRVDLGSWLILLVPVAISLGLTLDSARRFTATRKVHSSAEAGGRIDPVRTFGTAGLALLVAERSERTDASERRPSAGILDALATAGGSLLVKRPDESERVRTTDDGPWATL